jgi:hypothetical protein
LLGGSADAGVATPAVAPNIIASASKTESLRFKSSLLHFGTIAKGTIAIMRIGRIPQMDYLRSGFEDSRRWIRSRAY